MKKTNLKKTPQRFEILSIKSTVKMKEKNPQITPIKKKYLNFESPNSLIHKKSRYFFIYILSLFFRSIVSHGGGFLLGKNSIGKNFYKNSRLAKDSILRFFLFSTFKKFFITVQITLVVAMSFAYPASEVLMKAANKAMNKNQYKVALKIYKKALEEGANKAIVYYNMANVYYRQNNIPEAINHYRKTIDLAPHFKNAYLNMAKINYGYEEYYASIDIINEYLYLNPYDVESMVLVASIYRQTRNFVFAEKCLEIAKKIDPYYEDIYFEYADLFYKLGDIDKALNYLKEGIKFIPSSLYLKEQEARFHEEKKEYRVAANIYLTMISQFTNMDKEQIYYYKCDLADCFLNSGLTNSAIIELKEAAKMHPSAENAFYMLNSIYIKSGRFLEATEFYLDMFSQNHQIISSLIRDTFAFVYNQNNKLYINRFIDLYEEIGLVDELYKYVKESS